MAKIDVDSPVPTSYSLPPYLQKAVGDMAEELGMSKSAFVAGLLEQTVMELRQLKRGKPEVFESLADGGKANRNSRVSADVIDQKNQLIQSALTAHRRGW